VAAAFIRTHHAEEDEPAPAPQAEPALDVV